VIIFRSKFLQSREKDWRRHFAWSKVFWYKQCSKGSRNFLDKMQYYTEILKGKKIKASLTSPCFYLKHNVSKTGFCFHL
jgi:hypothetical protein